VPNDSEDYIGGQVQVGDSFTSRGDASAYDLDQDTMSLDGAFHDWDLTSIVPVGTKVVVVKATITDGTVGRYVWLQQKGFTGNRNYALLAALVANKSMTGHFLLSVDSDDRLLEYVTPAAAIDVIGLIIIGWWS